MTHPTSIPAALDAYDEGELATYGAADYAQRLVFTGGKDRWRKVLVIALREMAADGIEGLTWAHVDLLRDSASEFETRSGNVPAFAQLHALADLIASYLPPR